MTTRTPPSDFCALSAKLGQDPLRVQGPGGNTSIKMGSTMWIKASGTELSDAQTQDIFVAVDRDAAKSEAHGAGDGTCKETVLDKSVTLRPSIETTFHAAFDWNVVAHTHSVATIIHAICAQGIEAISQKLAGLPFAVVPYRKPGINLTKAILENITKETQIVILGNHGLIIAGESVQEVEALMEDVERCLALPVLKANTGTATAQPPGEYAWQHDLSALAFDARLYELAISGSYYPDHVVFLGPALPITPTPTSPIIVIKNQGVALKKEATPSQIAMARCIHDVLTRLPSNWTPQMIGSEAEHQLLNWDAEKYRQALAARGDA